MSAALTGLALTGLRACGRGLEAGRLALRGGKAVSFSRRRIAPCPICGFLSVVVAVIGGALFGARRLRWSRVMCLRGHRSMTAGVEG